MARDPNQLKYPESWVDTVDDLKKLPPPAGANKAEWDAKVADGTYYANVKVYQNGRRVIEWYKRGAGGGPGQPDPVTAAGEDVLPTVREEWDKDEDKTPPTVSAPPNQPNIVSRNPDGSLATTPNPNYTPPAGTNDWHTEGTPDPSKPGGFDNSRPIMVRTVNGQHQTRQPTAKELEDWNLAGQMTRNPGGKTDAQIAAEQKAAEDKARQDADRNKPGAPTLKPDGKGGTIAVQTMPDGSIKTTPLPDVPSDRPAPDRVTVNGVVYERNPESGQYAPAQGLPSEGAATVGGPPIPNFVLDASEQALTAYHAALWKDPSLTPAQREKRFQEAVQIAGVANQQWATQQRERESQRNAAYNTASTKLNYLQTGMSNALTFVSNLNGTLPEGSDLGGKAFAALLGLQMIQMGQSGINDLSTGARPAAPTLTPRDLSNPAVLETKRQEIAAQVTAAAQPNALGLGAIGNQPAPTGAPPAQPTAEAQERAAAAGGAPPDAIVRPIQPTPPMVPGTPSVIGDTGAPATPPPPSAANNPTMTVRNRTTGQTQQMTLAAFNALPNNADYDLQDPNTGEWAPMNRAVLPAPGSVPRPPSMQNMPVDRNTPPATMENMPITPSTPPAVMQPLGEGGDTPTSMAPWQQYPALASFQQSPTPASPAVDPSQFSQSPAVLHNRAATNPPWRISEEEYNQMRAAGIPDEIIMSVPGRVA